MVPLSMILIGSSLEFQGRDIFDISETTQDRAVVTIEH